MQVAKETTMTNLSDFLKVKKVRCVKAHYNSLTVGKEYSVLNIRIGVEVRDDEGSKYYWRANYFEPVLDSAENPLQEMKLTPEFEAVEPVLADNSVNTQDNSVNIQDTPKFKAGDKVYRGLKGEIRTVERVEIKSLHFADGGCDFIKHCCHATPENYERLQATFPDIKFEQPPKPLTGSDLARAMLDKGWKFVPCYVHDGSDDEAMNRKHYVSVKKETPKSGYNFSGTGANDWKYAVPIDPRTGEPLTESVLDE